MGFKNKMGRRARGGCCTELLCRDLSACWGQGSEDKIKCRYMHRVSVNMAEIFFDRFGKKLLLYMFLPNTSVQDFDFFFFLPSSSEAIEYNVILKNFGYFEMDTCNKSLLTDRIWIAKKAKFRNQHFTVMHFTQIVTDSDSLSTGSFCSWSLPGVTEDWSWSDWKSGNGVHQWKLLLCFGHSCTNLKVENRNRLIYFFLFQTLKNSLSNLFSI